MATEPTRPQADPAAETGPLLLALPDSVLLLVAARLPSPDKKAARLVCRALRVAVNSAVASFLLTDSNLPLLTLLEPKPRQQQDQPQQTHEPQQKHAPPRGGAPLHLTFPNLTHLCLALSPAAGPDSRRADQLRRLLRYSLPALRCLRCLDLSLACRDVVLGRTAVEVYDTWALIVEGLPASRPVRVLLHPPTALVAAAGGAGSGPCTAAATATSGFLCCGRNGGGKGDQEPYGLGGGRDYGHVAEANGGEGDDAAGVASSVGAMNVHGPGGGPGSGTSGGGGGGTCLLADMLSRLGAHRPAAEVRLVTAPLTSKRYDKPRIPPYTELLAALEPSRAGPSQGRTACPAMTGLVLGPESFTPGVSAASGFGVGEGEIGSEDGRGVGGGCNSSRGCGDGTSVAWLPLLDAANCRTEAALEQLTLWEAWPLATLFGAYGNACGSSACGSACRTPVASCLLGLRRLVLSDQQAVLDRDRLSADALAPLSALTRLTRLELASLTINAASAATAVVALGAAVHSKMGCGGGGGIGSNKKSWRAGGGGGGGSRAGAMRGSGKARAAVAAKPITPLPQVRHLSVYHALRVVWPPDGGGGCGGGGHAGDGSRGGSCSGYGLYGSGIAAAPLAALFPGLRHLSACVTHGSPGRPASERWGYLAGVGSTLTSLHLRAVAAEDLCLQGRSEVLAALTGVTALRLSAEGGKIDGIRGLSRTIACLGPGLVTLRLSRLTTRGTDARVAELALPHLTRLDFLGCSGELVGAFDALALSAIRLWRLEVRECETVRPADLQWATERQVGIRQLVIRDCPGLLVGVRRTGLQGGKELAAALRLALRPPPCLSISIVTTDSAEARTLRRSRHQATVGGFSCGRGPDHDDRDVKNLIMDNAAAATATGPSSYHGFTADDLDEL